MTCSKCFRLNSADARFCDWCGVNPERVSIQCTKCGANNSSHAKFCSACGCVLEPPLRVKDTNFRNDSNISATSVVSNVCV